MDNKTINYIVITLALVAMISFVWWVGYKMHKPERTVIVLGQKYLYSHHWDSHDSIYLTVVDTVQPYQIRDKYIYFKSALWERLHVTGIFRDRIDYFRQYIRPLDYKEDIYE